MKQKKLNVLSVHRCNLILLLPSITASFHEHNGRNDLITVTDQIAHNPYTNT